MRDTVRTFADLVYRVEAQIAAEDAIATHRKQFESQPSKRKRASGETTSPTRRKKIESSRAADLPRRTTNPLSQPVDLPPRPPRRDRLPVKEYTPLNTSRVNILMAIRDKETLQWPQALKPNAGNQDQYCQFHKSRGHKTEVCFRLKEEIERLIQQGYLGQFVKDRVLPNGEEIQTGGQPAQRQQRENQHTIREIATIAGGPLLVQEISIADREEPISKKSRISHSMTFDESDFEGVQIPHQDPLVVSAGIGDPCYNVKRILVDGGSSVDVLFYSTFLNMGLTNENLLPASGPLFGFNNQAVDVEGSITLPVTLGTFPRQATHSIQFLVVKLDSAYNAIFGRPLQFIFKAVASIPHLKLKFPTPFGVGTLRGDQKIAKSCYLRQAQPCVSETLSVESFDLRDENVSQRGSPVEDLYRVPLSEKDPSRSLWIGSLLPEDRKIEYLSFFMKNQDIFAWNISDMPGVDPGITMHSLKLNPSVKPVIQKKRNFAPERQRAIGLEVDKLLQAKYIREVSHP